MHISALTVNEKADLKSLIAKYTLDIKKLQSVIKSIAELAKKGCDSDQYTELMHDEPWVWLEDTEGINKLAARLDNAAETLARGSSEVQVYGIIDIAEEEIVYVTKDGIEMDSRPMTQSERHTYIGLFMKQDKE